MLHNDGISASGPMWNELTWCKHLGEGSYGEVFLALSRGEYVAVKRMETRRHSDEVKMHKFLDERQGQKELFPKFMELQTHGMCDYLVMEYCKNGSLVDYFSDWQITHKTFILPEERLVYFMKPVLNGLEFLHHLQIVHRDLKMDNVLLTDNWIPKIADFGETHILKRGEILYEKRGTRVYMAPEIWDESGYAFGCDVWSFGVLVFKMLCGFYPFEPPMYPFRLPIYRYRYLSDHAHTLAHHIFQIKFRRWNVSDIKQSKWMKIPPVHPTTPPPEPEPNFLVNLWTTYTPEPNFLVNLWNAIRNLRCDQVMPLRRQELLEEPRPSAAMNPCLLSNSPAQQEAGENAALCIGNEPQPQVNHHRRPEDTTQIERCLQSNPRSKADSNTHKIEMAQSEHKTETRVQPVPQPLSPTKYPLSPDSRNNCVSIQETLRKQEKAETPNEDNPQDPDKEDNPETPNNQDNLQTPIEKDNPQTPNNQDDPGIQNKHESPANPNEDDNPATPDKKENLGTPKEEDSPGTQNKQESSANSNKHENLETPNKQENLGTLNKHENSKAPSKDCVPDLGNPTQYEAKFDTTIKEVVPDLKTLIPCQQNSQSGEEHCSKKCELSTRALGNSSVTKSEIQPNPDVVTTPTPESITKSNKIRCLLKKESTRIRSFFKKGSTRIRSFLKKESKSGDSKFENRAPQTNCDVPTKPATKSNHKPFKFRCFPKKKSATPPNPDTHNKIASKRDPEAEN